MMKEIWTAVLPDTPLGDIWLAASAAGLAAVNLWGERERIREQVVQLTGVEPVKDGKRVTAVTQDAPAQLRQYLAGERRRFEIPLDWSVLTPFQSAVLQEVCRVGYGRVSSYSDIAAAVGKPKGAQAVGQANGRNPIPIVIPCHRILGRNGRLHGYAAPGGVETKAWLLRLEGSRLL